MDTDDLSNETYKATIITAEKFDHNLTLQFGLLSYECSDDDDYLKKADQLIQSWKSNLYDSIEEIFFDTEKPTVSSFEEILTKIQKQIEKVKNIPVDKR